MNLAFEGHLGFEKNMADFITTATTGGGVFFSSWCPFLHRECKILAISLGGGPKIDK